MYSRINRWKSPGRGPRKEAKEGSHKTSSFAAAIAILLVETVGRTAREGPGRGRADGWLVGQGKGEEHLFPPERRSSKSNKSCCSCCCLVTIKGRDQGWTREGGREGGGRCVESPTLQKERWCPLMSSCRARRHSSESESTNISRMGN